MQTKVSERSLRTKVWIVSFAAAAGIILILNLGLAKGGYAYSLFADGFVSCQTFMWIFFVVGFGELYVRRQTYVREQAAIGQGFLPEDPEILLTAGELGPIYKRVSACDDDLFLPRVIKRAVLQFQSTKSVDQAGTVLNSSMELGMHEIDLRYNMLRYIIWIIPTLGFIGTVVGIAAGLDVAAAEFARAGAGIDLGKVVKALGVAFYTTLLALVMSSILVLLTQIFQCNEEEGLNKSSQYCLDHLINKLYVPNSGS